MDSRDIIFIEINPHKNTRVISYNANNGKLNDFLHCFDIWLSHGRFRVCSDGVHQKVEFECSRAFFGLLEIPDFQCAFQRLGTRVTFNYDDVKDLD